MSGPGSDKKGKKRGTPVFTFYHFKSFRKKSCKASLSIGQGVVKGCEENAITINTLVKSTINAVAKRSQAFLEVSKNNT